MALVPACLLFILGGTYAAGWLVYGSLTPPYLSGPLPEMGAGGAAAMGGACDSSTANGMVPTVAFDDPQSRFNGASRQVDLNEVRLSNTGGPTVWYSDAPGHKAGPTPFTGSIRQVISAVNRTFGVDANGLVIGDRDYTAGGVRSPN